MTPRTPTTEDERIAVECLGRVTYPCASWDKRFSRQLSATALSEKERPQIWRLFKKYRRQITHPRKAELLAIAEKLAAPDLRKLNAAAKEQAIIDQMKKDANP